MLNDLHLARKPRHRSSSAPPAMPSVNQERLVLKFPMMMMSSSRFPAFHPCSRVRAVDLGSYWERSYFGDSTFLSMWAVPGTVIFWISLVLTLPGILLVTLSSPFLVRPRAQTTTGIISVVISHILLASNPKSLFLDNFSVNFAKVLPPELLLLF